MDHIQRHSRPGINPFFFVLMVAGAGFFLVVLVIASLLFFASRTVGDSKGNVGLVRVEGVIMSAERTVKKLIKHRENKSVKAIILRINSPGGGIAPSQEIFAEVKKTAAEKPVVVSMGSVAASGGYYIAAPATKIVANPGTITGSIGVILQHYVVGDLVRKLHLKWEIIKAGNEKDILNPLRRITPKERVTLQKLADELHEQFIADISKSRKLNVEEVRKLATGLIFSGEQAKELKLVDELGGEQAALELAAKLAKIEDKPKLIDDIQRDSLIDYLIDQSAQALSESRWVRGLLGQHGLYLPMAIAP